MAAAGRVAAARPDDRLRAPGREAILQPGCRNDEQRREKEAEQRVQPDQRDVEAAEAQTNPECPQRTVCLQAYAPDVLRSRHLTESQAIAVSQCASVVHQWCIGREV